MTYVCPLCKYDAYATDILDKYFWHLATEHKTTEFQIDRIRKEAIEKANLSFNRRTS